MSNSPLIGGCVAALWLAAAPILGQEVSPGSKTPLDLAALLPRETVAVVDWIDAGELVRGSQELLNSLRDLPPKVRLGIGLLPALARGVTGGMALEDAARLLSPHQGVLAAVVHRGRIEPLLLMRVGEPDEGRRRLVERLPALTRERDGVLAVAASPEVLGMLESAGRPVAAFDRPELSRGDGARVWIDLAAIRRRLGRVAWDDLDLPGRLFAGPEAAVLDASERFDGRLRIGAEGIRFEGRFDGGLRDAARHVVAGAEAGRELPPAPEGTLATLALDRDFHAFFDNLETILGQELGAQAGGFLSIADTLTGGSFVDNLLGRLDWPATLFVVREAEQDPEDAHPLDLPGFVAVVKVGDERVAQAVLRLVRTALIAGADQRKRDGKPQQLLRRRRDDVDRPLWVIESLGWRGPGAGPVDVRLTPTFAFHDGHLVLSSTRSGAERAMDALAGDGARLVGDRLQVTGAGVVEYLHRNRGLIELDEVLKDGVPLATARDNLDQALAIAGAFERLTIGWRPELEGTRVTFELEVRDE